MTSDDAVHARPDRPDPADSPEQPAGPERPEPPERPDRPTSPATPSRGAVLVAAVLVVAAGLATSRLVPGASGDALGDALYAALVLLLVTLVAPRRGLVGRAVVAVALCWAVELAQATGGPGAAVHAWPPLRYLLGTTFAWPDLVAYAIGVLFAGAVMQVVSVRSSGRRRPVTTRP